MKVFSEPGVLSRSERFFSTPSATARRLFYYVTRVGHYYYDARYNFLDSCDIAHLESHKNLFLTYVRSGTMYFETDQLYCAERGQIGLVDCRRPHHFYTKGDAEALWIHFDGANAAAFFEQILAFRGGRQVLTPPADLRIEQELAQIISGLRTGDMTELDRSQRIYRILCALLFPAQAGPDRKNDAIAQAVKYIGEHLFESLSVEKVADAVSLSPSHFSRQFKARTGYSPYEYIVLRRIDKAKYMLASTELSVKEIAYSTGYNSEENFIHSFRKNVGVAPGIFRKYPV